MGQVLHGSATTTEAIRRAIQHSQESLRALAKRYGINQKTVAKWKKRTSVADLPTGPKEPRSTVLSIEEEAIDRRLPPAYSAAARRLPLRAAADDPAPDALVAASLPAAPRHRRSARGRGRQAAKEEVQELSDRLLPHRHRRGADRRGQALPVRRHRSDEQVRLRATGRRRPNADRSATSCGPCRSRALQDPHRPDRQRHPVHDCQRPRSARPARSSCRRSLFGHASAGEARHRTSLTKPKHPWTNGQVERMNRTIKDATVKRYHYDDHDQLEPASRRLRRRLQLRTPTEDPQGPHTLRVHLQTMDNRARNTSGSIRSIKCRD